MSQLTFDDFEAIDATARTLQLYTLAETPQGKEFKQLEHTVPLDAVYSHFRHGMHPHLEKYRQAFRELNLDGLDLDDVHTDLVKAIAEEA